MFVKLAIKLASLFSLYIRGGDAMEERFRTAGQDMSDKTLDARVKKKHALVRWGKNVGEWCFAISQVWREKMAAGEGEMVGSAALALSKLDEAAAAQKRVAVYSELFSYHAAIAATGRREQKRSACHVRSVWTSPMRTPMAMAVTKGAPYRRCTLLYTIHKHGLTLFENLRHIFC